MAKETKKTASKKIANQGVRKPNPGTGNKNSRNPAGKGTRSQKNIERKAGVSSAAAKKLRGKSEKEKSPLKEK